jgi:outer membrane protein assembly factor BamE (lipoprotein component of BamABCDE complex)
MKHKMIASYFIVTVLFTLPAGCTHHMGNKTITDERAHAKVKEGVTTKQEIQTLFGKPTMVHFTDDNDEIWTYSYSKTSTRKITFVPILGLFFGGTDTQFHTLTVRYGEDGVVKAFGAGEMTGGGGGLQDLGK